MRDYEIVYIFRSSLTSEEIGAKLERYHTVITGGPGEVTASVHWGKRQLAYPIRKQRNGYYVVAQFASDPDSLVELERVLKLEDDVLRYLIVIAEHPLPLPEAMPAVPDAEGVAEEGGAEEGAAADEGVAADPEADDGAGAEAAAEEDAGEADADADVEADADADAEAEGDDAATEQDDAAADDAESDASADAKEE